MNPSHRVCLRRAFTLIELLIIVVVLSVLMAILIPTLNRVIARSHVASCQSNLRQIGIAWHLYATEHGGALAKYPGVNWFGWGGFDTGNFSGNQAERVLERPLNAYLSGEDVYKCPADDGFDFDGEPLWESKGTSYVANKWIFYSSGANGLPLSHAPSRIEQIVEPEKTIVIGDATMKMLTGGDFSSRAGYTENRTWHTSAGGGLKSNVVFADGHTELLLITTNENDEPEDGSYTWGKL